MQSSSSTPAVHHSGFNKHLRDRSKYALAVTVFALSANWLSLATAISAYSIYNLKSGTAVSVKNLKWMVISVISFVVSLVALICERGAAFVDVEKAYDFKMNLQFRADALRTVWWPTLLLFLACTWGTVHEHADNQEKAKESIVKSQ
jgi:ABC-type bacteriocin/lantibiotic exporter with double-glycine peptidase domain